MDLKQLKGRSPLVDVLLDIADQYFRKDNEPFGHAHDSWCRSLESNNRPCHCHRGKYLAELIHAASLVENASPDLYRAKSDFDIKAGEFFVIDLSTAKVMLESLPAGARMSPSVLSTLPENAEFAPPRKADAVNHPSHYNTGKIEVIEFIEDQKLDYHAGNAVKYVCRAGRKDPTKIVEDLKKAVWYLARKIELHAAAQEGRELKRPNDMNARPS